MISWFLSFFGARKGRGPAPKSRNCSEPELENDSEKEKSQKSSVRKSVSDLLEEFNQPSKAAMSKIKAGQTAVQRTANKNADATSIAKSTVNVRQSQKEEGTSSQENLLVSCSTLYFDHMTPFILE